MLLYSSIVVQFASTHWAAVIPMLVMWSAMLVNVIASILANLRVLKAQLLALRTFNVDATTTPAFTKYRMFVTLLVCTVLYYVMDITIFIFASLKLVPPWASALARQLLEIITAALIGHAFRARPLNAMFEQVQQIAMDLAQDLLPQISTVTVDVAALRGDGTVPWSRAIDLQAAKRTGQLSPVLTPPEMLLVLNPADTELLSASASGEKAAVQRALVVAMRVDDASRPAIARASSGGSNGGGGGGGSNGGGGGGGRRAVPMASLNALLGGATPWPVPEGRAVNGHSLARAAARGSRSGGGGEAEGGEEGGIDLTTMPPPHMPPPPPRFVADRGLLAHTAISRQEIVTTTATAPTRDLSRHSRVGSRAPLPAAAVDTADRDVEETPPPDRSTDGSVDSAAWPSPRHGCLPGRELSARMPSWSKRSAEPTSNGPNMPVDGASEGLSPRLSEAAGSTVSEQSRSRSRSPGVSRAEGRTAGTGDRIGAVVGEERLPVAARTSPSPSTSSASPLSAHRRIYAHGPARV